ncbi:MAG: DoxX family protein [Hyphomicrobium sp.]|jgi:putative oxidoreductase
MDLAFATVLVTVGQLLMGGLFVWAGLNHFGPAGEKLIPILAARGIPQPRRALYAASSFEAVCGACLMLGIAVAPVAIALVVFTIAVSVLLVNFWDMPEGDAREMLKTVWASNSAIVGGLLVTAAGAL